MKIAYSGVHHMILSYEPLGMELGRTHRSHQVQELDLAEVAIQMNSDGDWAQSGSPRAYIQRFMV